MSVLSLPRLVFRGTTSWNPNTVNNGPVTYDETDAAPQFYPQGYPPGGPPVDAGSYDSWLKTYNDQVGLPGSWNVYGDQGCAFAGAEITGIQLASGPAGGDPLLGQPVQMVGQSYFTSSTPPACRMVDVDPYSPYTTQIIYLTIVIGDTTVGVTGPGVVRMFSRWPNMARNLGGLPIAGNMGVMWQATVAAAQLTWYGVDQSPALAALQQAIAQGGQGLALLFASYRTLYFTRATWQGTKITNDQELSQAYLAGFTGSNPAVSAALGTIGVWGPGELASAPTERALVPGAALSPSATPTLMAARSRPAARTRAAQEGVGLEAHAAVRAAALELAGAVAGEAAAAAAPQAVQVQLGTAFARVDGARNVVTLDFLGSFPEQDANLVKADFGDFQLQAVPPGGVAPVAIGQPLTYAQYDEAAYEAGGGMVEVAFDPGQLGLVTTGLLQLVQSSSGALALAETALLAETDQRGVYLDQGQTQQVTVQVYQQGVTPPAGGVEILLATYDEQLNNVSPDQSILQLLDAQGNPLPDPPVLTVGADGSATFGVTPRQSGIAMVFFLPYAAGAAQPQPPDIGNMAQIPDSYAAVRALPFDNELLKMQPADITWDFVYKDVLQTYNLVYPLMSLVLNLASEATVNQNAQQIDYATSLQQWLTTLFMPITREMSAGKRYVLQQYLAQQ
jgi:hypothetical protein